MNVGMKESEILQSGVSFHGSLEDDDINLTRQFWSDAEYARHFGWKALNRWGAIVRNCKTISSNLTMMRTAIHDVHADIFMGVALISLIDGIKSIWGMGQGKSATASTNKFEGTDIRWLMNMSHGSVFSFPDRTSQYN